MPKNSEKKGKNVESLCTIISDVNVWISMFRTPSFRERSLLLFQPPCKLLYSTALLEELDKVAHRPKHWNVIDTTEYEKIRQWILKNAVKVDIHSVVNVCRDPNDNYLLALAKDGEADYLLTGDADLLTLKEFGKTKIMQLTDFIKLMKK